MRETHELYFSHISEFKSLVQATVFFCSLGFTSLKLYRWHRDYIHTLMFFCSYVFISHTIPWLLITSGRLLSNCCSSMKRQIKAWGERSVRRLIMAHINPVYWGKSRWKRHSVTEERTRDRSSRDAHIHVQSLHRDRNQKHDERTGLWTFSFLSLFSSHFLMNYSPVKHCEWWNRPQILVPGFHHIEKKILYIYIYIYCIYIYIYI